MICLTTSKWGGMLTPGLLKHKVHRKQKHPEHMINHIIIDSITMLTDDEIQAYDEDFESDLDYDQLLELGDGGISWLVTMHWDGEIQTYDYVLNMDEPEELTAKILIASQHTPTA